MSRFELTEFDRYRIGKAREELNAAKALDLSDDRAMARALGGLEATLEQLLAVFDEDGAS